MIRLLCMLAIAVSGCWSAPQVHAPATPTSQLADLDDTYPNLGARDEAGRKACPVISHRLWRIEKDGKTSHLFGTNYIGVGRDRLPAAAETAFSSARVVAVESLKNNSRVLRDTGRSLASELGADAWARL